MKNLSRNSIIFGIIALIISLLFYHYLYQFLAEKSFRSIPYLALAYAFSMFIAGFLLGYFDPVRKYRGDLGFLYHLITFIIVNVVNVGFLLFAIAPKHDNMISALIQVGTWSIFLYVHFRGSKKRIKGMRDEDAFV